MFYVTWGGVFIYSMSLVVFCKPIDLEFPSPYTDKSKLLGMQYSGKYLNLVDKTSFCVLNMHKQ